MVEIEIILKGELPPFIKISDHLWGKNSNIDSDGNSITPDSTDWNELMLTLRSDEEQRIDIYPVEGKSGVLKLQAANLELAQSVISFLQQYGSIK